MFEAHNIIAGSYVSYQALLSAVWLRDFFSTLLNSMKQRCLYYKLMIFTRIFQPKIGRQTRIFSLRWKNNILILKVSGQLLIVLGLPRCKNL